MSGQGAQGDCKVGFFVYSPFFNWYTLFYRKLCLPNTKATHTGFGTHPYASSMKTVAPRRISALCAQNPFQCCSHCQASLGLFNTSFSVLPNPLFLDTYWFHHVKYRLNKILQGYLFYLWWLHCYSWL